jgi:hypothetical protein
MVIISQKAFPVNIVVVVGDVQTDDLQVSAGGQRGCGFVPESCEEANFRLFSSVGLQITYQLFEILQAECVP